MVRSILVVLVAAVVPNVVSKAPIRDDGLHLMQSTDGAKIDLVRHSSKRGLHDLLMTGLPLTQWPPTAEERREKFTPEVRARLKKMIPLMPCPLHKVLARNGAIDVLSGNGEVTSAQMATALELVGADETIFANAGAGLFQDAGGKLNLTDMPSWSYNTWASKMIPMAHRVPDKSKSRFQILKDTAKDNVIDIDALFRATPTFVAKWDEDGPGQGGERPTAYPFGPSMFLGLFGNVQRCDGQMVMPIKSFRKLYVHGKILGYVKNVGISFNPSKMGPTFLHLSALIQPNSMVVPDSTVDC